MHSDPSLTSNHLYHILPISLGGLGGLGDFFFLGRPSTAFSLGDKTFSSKQPSLFPGGLYLAT